MYMYTYIHNSNDSNDNNLQGLPRRPGRAYVSAVSEAPSILCTNYITGIL